MPAKGRLSPPKPPLMLFHGLGMTAESAWQEVVPLLSELHEIFMPTALGHPGGPTSWRRPVLISDVVDAAEQHLDQCGLERPHLAGNSLGGYVAIELARRGRASTVCALSPAGFWMAGDRLQSQLLRKFKTTLRMARLTQSVSPLMLKSATFRRLMLRDTACHGRHLTPDSALKMSDDYLASPAIIEIIAGSWQVTPVDPLPCPITIGWSGKDATLPLARYEKSARQRLPQAVFEVIPGVGHVPMFDDPHLVARMILASTAAKPASHEPDTRGISDGSVL
jgi:pimeloyl-ACP methyl ester carboxylesterase